ncbi:Zinc finger B-box domain-containing protein 1 [Holothuria leucospilota]|uniref:Zinc finger B-box domain-containing protein 1 n=1 Tax=Holothuria leucospilota TaxID=206669 RepID=A0A9Q1BPV8_HOLLE|nr:Zinc finger B-box domain-containing protein 1 [Holothuria leucospilota]
MSSLRPFNTSTKAPKSVKLKGFSSDKNVTQQLEIDSRRMEEKLNQLKMTMNREKQERQLQGRGNIWASGKASGTLTAHGSEILNKQTPQKPSKPADKNKVRKVKVLKDTPLDIPERPKASDRLFEETQLKKKSFKGPACGQCESKPVSLTCMECGENYCTTCFAKFHLKGALRNHRSVPYQSPSDAVSRTSWDEENNNHRVVGKKRPETPKSSRGSTSHTSDDTQGKVVVVKTQQDPTPSGGSLLQGEYNEAESAASFAAALAEWRNSKKKDGGNQKIEIVHGDKTVASHQSKPEVHDMGVGDSSLSESNKNVVEIKFSDSSLSYADKLLLKKHRRTEIPSLSGSSPISNPSRARGEALVNGSLNDLEMNAEMQEEHERCVQIFSRNSHSPLLPESNRGNHLVITEMLESEGDNLEVESVYSVEEVSTQPVVNGPQTETFRECEVTQIMSPDDLVPRMSDENLINSSVENRLSEMSLSGQSPAKVPTEGTGLNLGTPTTSTKGSNQQRSGEGKEQKIDKTAKPEDNSRKSSARGLTKNPSEDLKRVLNLDQGGGSARSGQHRYTDGLGRFFMAGLGQEGSEEVKTTREENLSSETEKCTYQGPGVWRPSSSLSVHNDETVAHVPSPPKQTKERKGSAPSRRKQSGTKKKEQVGDNIISWTLSEHPPPGVGGDGIHSNVRKTSSSSGRSTSSLSKKGEHPRSASRIEIEGDNFERFDDDDGQQGQDAADEETLEELTWELASQSGRLSADGRISSLSLQDVEPYIKNTMFASSLDEELGIVLDDGHGSGLSTPYDDIAMERLSEEDLQADFEEIETARDKQAVEDLDAF